MRRARRPRDLDAYSLERNGSLGRELLVAELESASGLFGGSDSGSKAADDGAASSEGRMRGRGRHMLLGHSMGAACAAAEAIENPEVRAQRLLSAPVKTHRPLSTQKMTTEESGRWGCAICGGCL